VVYAWPLQADRTGFKVFAIDEQGALSEFQNPGFSGIGSQPPYDFGFAGRGSGKSWGMGLAGSQR
jgi:hypothetical protein